MILLLLLAAEPPKGFSSLLDGRSLAGWHGMPRFDPVKLAAMKPEERKKKIDEWTDDAKKHWSVEKGELVADGKGAFLATDQDFGDIELLGECKGGGVRLRGSGEAPIKSDDAWSRFRILQVGERTSVHLGGKLVADHIRMENDWDKKKALPRTGPIQLGGAGRFRNLFVRKIGAEEANEILGKHGAKGFAEVFDGKSFDGWAGPLENYEVKEGAIVCRPKKGGNIFTKAEYGDFVARVEYRLPPAGNNGLALRYPGKGQPSSVAMCEVQILDDDAPVYKKLDPRQYNGSAYGILPAQRGYLRPTGEWNFIEVRAKGHHLEVELNGSRILSGDLSKVEDFKDGKQPPGMLRLKGHFGFCGHSDPVAFRNIRIKPLE